jgi:hypothetical protein
MRKLLMSDIQIHVNISDTVFGDKLIEYNSVRRNSNTRLTVVRILYLYRYTFK